MPFQRAVTALVREQLSKWLTKHCVAPHALKLNAPVVVVVEDGGE